MKKLLPFLMLIPFFLNGQCPGFLGTGFETISSIPFTDIGHNTTSDVDDITAALVANECDGNYLTGNDYVYIFTPGVTGDFIFELNNQSSIWGGFQVFDDCPDVGICVGESTTSLSNESATISLTSGTTYYVVVDIYASPTSYTYDFSLDVAPPPPPAPGNDECNDAVELVCGVTLSNQTTEGSLPPDNPVGCASDYGVWYYFTGTGLDMTVSSDAESGYDHEMDIFTSSGGCGGPYSTVICDDGAGGGGIESHTFTTTLGQVYYVYIAHFSTSSSLTGEFDISLTCACNSPVATATLSGTCPVYSIDVDLTSLGGAGTVNITNDVNGSEFLGVSALQVYQLTGFAPGDGTVTVRVEDAGDPTCFDEYTVAIPSACPPSNDDCGNATPITPEADLSCSNPVAGTTVNATQSIVGCVGSADDDVWYSFMASSSEHNIIINNTGGSSDIVTEVFDGCGGTSLVCQDTPNSPITLSGLSIGTTYYFRIYSYFSSTSSFEVCVGTPAAPPANDDCSGATSYTASYTLFAEGGCIGTPNSLDLTSATDDAGNDDPTCDGSGNYGVWFTWTATSTGLDFTSGTGAPGFAIYESGTCGTLNSVGCLNNESGQINGLTVSDDYIIYIWDDTQGNTVTFCLEEYTPPAPPLNDDCVGAVELTCGATLNNQTTSSTVPPDDPVGCASDYGVWYYFTGTGAEMTVSSDAATGYDHEIDIFTLSGGCGGSSVTIVCQDGAFSGGVESYTFTTTLGQVYYVYVAHYDGASSTTGDFDISLDCACNSPAATAVLSGTCPTFSVDVDLTSLGGATSVNITNDVNGSEFLGVSALQVYSLTGFAPGDGTVTIRVEDAGDPTCFEEYLVAIPSGCPPTNDMCMNATSLSMGSTVTGNTDNATDSDQPASAPCSGGGGGTGAGCGTGVGSINWGDGVWYVYNSTTAEEITVDLSGSSFDTEVQVFSGSCGSLTCVGGDDDSGALNTSLFCWTSTASFAPVDYYIYVDGHSVNSGDFTLNISSTVLPIDLVSFTAKAMPEGNDVRWTTASEVNNEYQQVQRSENGNSDWVAVETIENKGDFEGIRDYQIMDKNPYPLTYYRLKSVDWDGYTQYSNVVSVQRKSFKSDLKVTPNPATDVLFVSGQGFDETEEYNLTVFDVTGRLVIEQKLENGWMITPAKININELNQGVYFLRVFNNNSSVTKRIIIN